MLLASIIYTKMYMQMQIINQCFKKYFTHFLLNNHLLQIHRNEAVEALLHGIKRFSFLTCSLFRGKEGLLTPQSSDNSSDSSIRAPSPRRAAVSCVLVCRKGCLLMGSQFLHGVINCSHRYQFHDVDTLSFMYICRTLQQIIAEFEMYQHTFLSMLVEFLLRSLS